MSSDQHAGPANRLIHETSPYLLQHAYNPVDWRPWGPEAIAAARDANKPIFLSIGYSACHWCHVMERESFENAEIAKFLNEHFISIKVDREERPDIDDIYMQAVQMMTGHGGWPMSVFLTPDLRPFFGGTYFPPENRQGMPGFMTLIRQLNQIHESNPNKIEETAREMHDALKQQEEAVAAAGAGVPPVTREIVGRAARGLESRFDRVHGGFGPAPKFPPSMGLNLLMRERARSSDPHLDEPIERTLQKMARGGLFDQLGGGFHRYSVDNKWLAPHFEKMLYDNALLAPVYFDAFLMTGNPFYERVGRDVLDYVLGRMTDPAGGYYSAEDADSEGEEGKYYVWSDAEVREALGADADLFAAYYDVTPRGNFEGHNILNVITPFEEFVVRRGVDAEEAAAKLAAGRKKLLEIRARRVAPHRDDKILAAWNGMMISAMARGAQVTGDARYLDSARAAADFVLGSMRAPDGGAPNASTPGGLLRTWGRGRGDAPAAAKIPAFLEDYAFVIGGLIDLYETEFDPRRLEEADRLTTLALAKFEDKEAGGFFTTEGSDPTVLLRRKDTYDGATPSGNSAMTFALLRLATLLDRADYREAAMRAIAAMGVYLDRMPAAAHHLICAVDFALGQPLEIAVIGDLAAPETRALLEVIWKSGAPNRVIACAPADKLDEGFSAKIAILKDKQELKGHPTAYVCRNRTCDKPTGDPMELKGELK